MMCSWSDTKFPLQRSVEFHYFAMVILRLNNDCVGSVGHSIYEVRS